MPEKKKIIIQSAEGRTTIESTYIGYKTYHVLDVTGPVLYDK
jgi:hypothetical protein